MLKRTENITGRVNRIKRKILRALREITHHVGVLVTHPVEVGKLMLQERILPEQHPGVC